jgi:hypothetical protein
VDQGTGLRSWQANLTGPPTPNSSIFEEDQIAYFALGGSGSLTLYGMISAPKAVLCTPHNISLCDVTQSDWYFDGWIEKVLADAAPAFDAAFDR